jgi:hypothetical protein
MILDIWQNLFTNLFLLFFSLKQQELHNLITDSHNGSLTENEYADVKILVS